LKSNCAIGDKHYFEYEPPFSIAATVLLITELLCPTGAPARGRRLFAVVTLKLEGDLNFLKMYLQTEYEVGKLMHSKLIMVGEIYMVNEKIRK